MFDTQALFVGNAMVTVQLSTRLIGVGRRGDLIDVTLDDAGALLSGRFARLVMADADGVQEVSTDGPRPKGTRTVKPSRGARGSDGGGVAAGDVDDPADTKPGEGHVAG